MNEVNQSLALAHAAKEFPREACGLLSFKRAAKFIALAATSVWALTSS